MRRAKIYCWHDGARAPCGALAAAAGAATQSSTYLNSLYRYLSHSAEMVTTTSTGLESTWCSSLRLIAYSTSSATNDRQRVQGARGAAATDTANVTNSTHIVSLCLQ